MFFPSDHLLVYQDFRPCPTRLQENTWRTGGVLTGFFMSLLNKIFSIGFEYIYKQVGINFSALSRASTMVRFGRPWSDIRLFFQNSLQLFDKMAS